MTKREQVQNRVGIMSARRSHVHDGCGHGCFCYNSRTPDCRRCQNERFNAAMAQQYREDQRSTEQLLGPVQ